ncbi:hypothetical protein EHQ75_16950 [Leptospira levettii]|uniref:MAE_28990/MAE_18760 family HEPN-like nuclease n=1 Tax=Leptospira levettii TaxID=2023178 RepID=UPI0010847418|nr:MAE_28990/MAE_18760 family HEPN-like nuclease [Leptospira levettii]TGM35615.1 hypothetical protein EHQ75_16950 [Leptospira levettii]
MIQTENIFRNRSGEVIIFLNYIISLENGNSTEPISSEVKILRGLFFVHLYSLIESVINELTQETLREIKSKSYPNNQFNLPFNTISLNSQIRSLKDSGYKKYFKKVFELFDSISSSNVFDIDETMFGTFVQNIWFATIEEIFLCFGLSTSILTISHRVLINEIVDNRNSISHGRKPTIEIGEKYTAAELKTKYDNVLLFLETIISKFKTFIEQEEYIKAS